MELLFLLGFAIAVIFITGLRRLIRIRKRKEQELTHLNDEYIRAMNQRYQEKFGKSYNQT